MLPLKCTFTRSLGGVFYCLSRAGNTLCSRIEQTVTSETHMALLVLTELLTAIRAKDAQGFREWLDTAFDTFGLTAVEELFREYLLPLLSDEECDRIVGWRLGVSF